MNLVDFARRSRLWCFSSRGKRTLGVVLLLAIAPYPLKDFSIFFAAVKQHFELWSPFEQRNRLVTDPGVALDALPPSVVEGIQLLQRHRLSSYRLDESLRADPLFFQRIAEGAYPIQIQKESRNLIYPKNVPLKPGCRALDSGREVAVAVCP